MSGAPKLDPRTVRFLQKAVLNWYDTKQRDLPWRRKPSLYGTWIAEVMLQQTTVKVVTPYWERFLARFPDQQALARATEEEVLSCWSGLGYYRRARALHSAARQILNHHHGELPQTRAGWLSLPGVGPYTAGAIASIGLGETVGAVDANSGRVLARLVSDTARRAAALTLGQLQEMADRLVDPDRPGDWNQALMELGALTCQPAAPRCHECPAADRCLACRSGWVRRIAKQAKQGEFTPVRLSVLVLRKRGFVLMLPAAKSTQVAIRGWGRPIRSDFSQLFKGLWHLPGTAWYGDSSGRRRARDASTGGKAALVAWRHWLAECGGSLAAALTCCGVVSHAVTVYRLRLWVVSGRLRDTGMTLPVGARWVRAGSNRQHPYSAMTGKALRLAGVVGQVPASVG